MHRFSEIVLLARVVKEINNMRIAPESIMVSLMRRSDVLLVVLNFQNQNETCLN